MSGNKFSDMKDKYPEIISKMDQTFTSHEFILKLAQQYQVEYIDVLFVSRGHLHRDKNAPFRYVHHQLASLLKTFPDFVRKTGEVDSIDIFRQFNRCAEWEKVGNEKGRE